MRTGPTLVGRKRELAEIRAAFGAAVAGAGPRVVVLTGVAGIGKTSVCGALAAEFDAAGALVLTGTCPRQWGQPMTYAPFVSMWRAASGPDSGFADLVVRLCRLGELPAEIARTWLCDQVLAQLSEWCVGHPAVVLVVDDAHWIDPASLAMLHAIGRATEPRHLLLVVSARSDVMEKVPGATVSLVELATAPHAAHLTLGPLPDDAVRALAREAAGRGSVPALDSVVRRAEGNPLYARELARHHGNGLPDSLHMLLRQRLRDVGEDGARLVAAVALAGDVAIEDRLGDVLDVPAATASELVERGIRHGLLSSDGPDARLRPSHSLYVEAAVAVVSGASRRDLHRRLAVVLSGGATARPADLAWHWERAGAPERALRCWYSAGQAEADRHAHAAAVEAYRHALRLSAAPGAAGSASPTRWELMLATATALRWCGRLDEASQTLRSALATAPAGDPTLRCQLLYQLWECNHVAGAPDRASEALAEALSLAADLPDGALAARLAVAEASQLMAEGRYAEAVRPGTAAVRRAAAADATIHAWALSTMGVCLALDGAVSEGVAALDAARKLAHTCGSVRELTRAAGNLTFVLANTGRHQRCARVGQEALRRLARLGLADALGGPLSLNVAVSLVALGRWDELGDVATDNSALPKAKVARLMLCRAEVAALRGDTRLVADLLDRAAKVVGGIDAGSDRRFDAEQTIPVAVAARAAGRPRAALQSCREILTRPPDGLGRIEHLRLCAEALGALSDLQLIRGRVNRFDEPAAVAAELLAAADRTEPRTPEEAALRALCDAEAGRLPVAGSGAPAAGRSSRWERLAEAWDRLDMPYPAGYARMRLAEALVAEHQPRCAAEPLQRAHTVAVALGAAPLCREVERVARRGRLPLDEAPGPDQPTTSDGPRLEILTRREREVLELIGWGHTNRDIARTLVLSERTVGVHVSNILGKLGAQNRAAAARIARQATAAVGT